MILPLVVAGIILLVQNSTALAFSLGGIVGAVSFRNRVADTKDTMRKIDAGVGPAMAKLPDIANQLQGALTQVNRLASSINAGYGGESRLNRDIETLVRQLTDTARSVRALSDLLTRNPEALIKGRGKD